jgi:hypothetical protein
MKPPRVASSESRTHLFFLHFLLVREDLRPAVAVVVVRAAVAAFFGLVLDTAALAGLTTFVIVGFFGAADFFFVVLALVVEVAFLAAGLPTSWAEDSEAAAAS